MVYLAMVKMNFFENYLYIIQLLGGELYHYHSKVIQKEARTGGAHIWHQDYGYCFIFQTYPPGFAVSHYHKDSEKVHLRK